MRYGNSCAQYDPERLNPIEHDLLSQEIKSTIWEKLPPPPRQMIVVKVPFNSIISTKGARFIQDNGHLQLLPQTPLHRSEFIRMKLSDILDKMYH
jgi:hypothetical protein